MHESMVHKGLAKCFTEADFEADELAEAPALEDEAFDLDQEQQPARLAPGPAVLSSDRQRLVLT